MDILKLLKEGMSVEDITEDFFDALSDAQEEYEEYLKEQEEKRKAAEARKVELEYKKTKQQEARAAVGAAIVNYFESLGIVITENMLEDIDNIIDLLPQLKVYKSGKVWQGIWR